MAKNSTKKSSAEEDAVKKDSLNDRRSRFTRELIRNTYLDMLEASTRKITVASLCREADISRGTFYLHYQDIIDVQEDVEEEFFKEMCRLHAEVMAGNVVDHEEELSAAKRNDRRWALLYYSDNASLHLTSKLYDYSVDFAMSTVFKDVPYSEEEKRVAAIFSIYAALAVDRYAYNHPWKNFDETNRFYDSLIRSVTNLILSGDFLRK